MRRALFSTFLLGACLLLASCGTLESSNDRGQWHVQPGAIIHYQDTSDVELSADTIQVGDSLRVSATTFGGGCTRAAGSLTERSSQQAVLVPLDSVYNPGPNEVCTLELNTFVHRADVVFENPGTAHVVVRGREENPDPEDEEEVQLERTVVVVE